MGIKREDTSSLLHCCHPHFLPFCRRILSLVVSRSRRRVDDVCTAAPKNCALSVCLASISPPLSTATPLPLLHSIVMDKRFTTPRRRPFTSFSLSVLLSISPFSFSSKPKLLLRHLKSVLHSPRRSGPFTFRHTFLVWLPVAFRWIVVVEEGAFAHLLLPRRWPSS